MSECVFRLWQQYARQMKENFVNQMEQTQIEWDAIQGNSSQEKSSKDNIVQCKFF